MDANKYLKKFIPEDYINRDCLVAEYEGNISIVGNRITFAHLEFDAAVKINLTSLVLSKDTTYDILDQEIYRFKGKNDDDSTYPVKLETLDYEFTGCVFNDNVHFNLPETRIGTIYGCIFKEHFYINGYLNDDKTVSVNTITIEDSIFEKDFAVYNAEINTIKIKNVDFLSLSEFNEVTFQKEFDLKEITYKGFTLFDNCIFNTKAGFEYIVFEKFTSFRGSRFNEGLNLDYTSSDKEINFFGINGLESKESKEYTSQETYRIIKYNFEKIGNKIEANKYHALELDQKRREFKKSIWKNKKDYTVFQLHYLSSKHSTNWFLALLWIFTVGFLTVFLLHFDIAKDLFFNPTHFKIEYINNVFNELFQFIYIGHMEPNLKNIPWLLLLNKVSLGYLYYQFLTAVRKDTSK